MSKEREVQQVLANYVRAADRRDAAAMSSLFVDEAHVEICEGQQGPRKIGLIEGSDCRAPHLSRPADGVPRCRPPTASDRAAGLPSSQQD
jgi:hypothetical protein